MPPRDEPPAPRDRAWASALAARDGLSDISTEPADSDSWSVGDILLFDRSDVAGIGWLILEVEADGHRYRCAPVDHFGLLGPRDLLLFEEDEAPWSLRPAFEIVFGKADLADARRLDRLDAARVRAVLENEPEGLHRVDEDLPAYREWIEDGPVRAFRDLSPEIITFEKRSPKPSAPEARADEASTSEGSSSRPWSLWLAAVLAFAVLGLGIRMDQMGRQIAELDSTVEQLSVPILGLPYGEVAFLGIPRGPVLLNVPEAATHLQIGMVVPRDADFERYRVEVLSGQELIYRSSEVSARSTIDITFPLVLLDRPDLRLHLYGLGDSGATFIDEERFEIVRESAR